MVNTVLLPCEIWGMIASYSANLTDLQTCIHLASDMHSMRQGGPLVCIQWLLPYVTHLRVQDWFEYEHVFEWFDEDMPVLPMMQNVSIATLPPSCAHMDEHDLWMHDTQCDKHSTNYPCDPTHDTGVQPIDHTAFNDAHPFSALMRQFARVMPNLHQLHIYCKFTLSCEHETSMDSPVVLPNVKSLILRVQPVWIDRHMCDLFPNVATLEFHGGFDVLAQFPLDVVRLTIHADDDQWTMDESDQSYQLTLSRYHILLIMSLPHIRQLDFRVPYGCDYMKVWKYANIHCSWWHQLTWLRLSTRVTRQFELSDWPRALRTYVYDVDIVDMPNDMATEPEIHVAVPTFCGLFVVPSNVDHTNDNDTSHHGQTLTMRQQATLARCYELAKEHIDACPEAQILKDVYQLFLTRSTQATQYDMQMSEIWFTTFIHATPQSHVDKKLFAAVLDYFSSPSKCVTCRNLPFDPVTMVFMYFVHTMYQYVVQLSSRQQTIDAHVCALRQQYPQLANLQWTYDFVR